MYILFLAANHHIWSRDRNRLYGRLIWSARQTCPRVISDLPEKVETTRYCTLTKEQATPYEAVVQGEMLQIEEAEGIHRRGLVLSRLIQLKKICDEPGQHLHQAGFYPENGGEALRLEMDEAVNKAHKSCQHVYGVVTSKRDFLIGIIQFNEDWFPGSLKDRPKPAE